MFNRVEIEEVNECKKNNWQNKALNCVQSLHGHELIPISWAMTPTSKHVKMLMCTLCFHEINIAEAFECRPMLE